MSSLLPYSSDTYNSQDLGRPMPETRSRSPRGMAETQLFEPSLVLPRVHISRNLDTQQTWGVKRGLHMGCRYPKRCFSSIPNAHLLRTLEFLCLFSSCFLHGCVKFSLWRMELCTLLQYCSIIYSSSVLYPTSTLYQRSSSGLIRANSWFLHFVQLYSCFWHKKI